MSPPTSGIVSVGYGMGVATGDMDNDGWTDLYVTNLGANQMWRNRGDGTFEDVTAAARVGDDRWGTSAVFFDFDRDGWLDLFAANYIDGSFEAHTICTDRRSNPDYCGPASFPWQPDLLLHNLGGGVFEDVSAILSDLTRCQIRARRGRLRLGR